MPKKTLIEVKFQAKIIIDLNDYPGLTFDMMSQCIHDNPTIIKKVNENIECVALKHID